MLVHTRMAQSVASLVLARTLFSLAAFTAFLPLGEENFRSVSYTSETHFQLELSVACLLHKHWIVTKSAQIPCQSLEHSRR